MISNYFTLFHFAKELDKNFCNAKIVEIFSQEKDNLVISFLQEEKEFFLTISCAKRNEFIFFKKEFQRAKKNTIDFFPEIIGEKINKIYLETNDRVLGFEISNEKKIYIKLFSQTANVYLNDKYNNAISSFKKDELIEFSVQNKITFFKNISIEFFDTLIKNNFDNTIFKFLKTAFSFFNSIIAKEICFRSSLNQETICKNLSLHENKSLINSINTILFDLLENPNFKVYFSNETTIFSLVNLEHQKNCEEKNFLTLNDAIYFFIVEKGKKEFFKKNFTHIKTQLQIKFDRLQKSEIKIQEQLDKSKIDYNKIGNIIISNLNAINKSENEISLLDYETNEKIKIQLDEKLSPIQNAQKYFEKQKKSEVAKKELGNRIKKISLQKKLFQTQIINLGKINSFDELKKFASENKINMLREKEKLDAEKIPFRIFFVSGNYEVWVGKNSSNNDLLTTQYAKPNDLWFHARGSGGSHVVLKCHGKNFPSKETIKDAASIAAYYSQMRNAKHVPVAYCEKKYVRKPKSVKEGTVFIQREEVIFVEPKLPKQISEE